MKFDYKPRRRRLRQPVTDADLLQQPEGDVLQQQDAAAALRVQRELDVKAGMLKRAAESRRARVESLRERGGEERGLL